MTQAISSSPRSDRLSREILDAVETVCALRTLGAGDVLYSAGDPAGSVYFVLCGRLQASIPSRVGAPTVVGEVGKGHAIGVVSLLPNQVYPISMHAIRETRVAGLSPESFERLSREDPDMLLSVVRFIIQSVRQLAFGAPAVTSVGTVALLPVGDDVPARLADDLVAALQLHGSVHLVAPDGAGGAPPTGEDPAVRLENLERDHDFVVYAGSPRDLDWNRTCLARADRVLLAADGRRSPDTYDAMTSFLRSFQADTVTRCDLLLLRGEDEPTATTAWLESASFDRWYHVRPGNRDDNARLARWLAAEAVGLVLSGGGARGFAHMGVVRALREAGVPIDAVAGTSMGGIMGACVACDWDYPTMVAAATRTFVQSSPLRDFTIPLVSFVSGRRISRLLRETFGDRQIEDLPIPFMCVSCNLSRAEAAYHSRGPLWEALRATVAIPAVIAPTVRQGDLHVDGGAIDNMPVGAMRRAGVQEVIAVDVSPLDTFASHLPDTDSLKRPSIFEEVLRRRQARRERVPSLVSILRRSGSVSTMALQRQARTEADRAISLQLEGVKMLDWQRLEEIAGLGYQAARTQVAQWQRSPGWALPT